MFLKKKNTIFTLGTIITVEQPMMTGSSSKWEGRIICRVCGCDFLHFDPIWRRKSNMEQNNDNKWNADKTSKINIRHGDLKWKKIKPDIVLKILSPGWIIQKLTTTIIKKSYIMRLLLILSKECIFYKQDRQ